MIFKSYLHRAVITLKHGTNKSIQKRTNFMIHNNYSAQCCNYDRSKKPSIILMPNKPTCDLKLQSNQIVAFSSYVSYKSEPGTSFSSSPHDDETQEDPYEKGIIFSQREAPFHHNVLEESSAYSSTIFKSDPNFSDRYILSEEEFSNLLSTSDWESKSPSHIAAAFASCGLCSANYLNVSMDDHRFDKLVDAFESKCLSFTDDEMMDCLIAIKFWPKSDNVKAENFLRVWKALDNLCFERILDWSHDKILFVMDLWYQIRLIRLCNFSYHGIKKISRRCKE